MKSSSPESVIVQSCHLPLKKFAFSPTFLPQQFLITEALCGLFSLLLPLLQRLSSAANTQQFSCIRKLLQGLTQKPNNITLFCGKPCPDLNVLVDKWSRGNICLHVHTAGHIDAPQQKKKKIISLSWQIEYRWEWCVTEAVYPWDLLSHNKKSCHCCI